MFDFIVLALLLICLLASFFRGFIKECFGLLGLVLSLYITIEYYDYFSSTYVTYVHSEMISAILSTISVFMLIIITVIIVNGWLMYLLAPIRLNLFDRVAGLVLGATKGVFFSYLLFVCITVVATALSPTSSNNSNKKNVNTPHERMSQPQEDIDKREKLPLWFTDSYSYKIIDYVNDYIEEPLQKLFGDKIEDLGDKIKDMKKHPSSDQ